MKTAPMKVELIDRMGTDLTIVNAARVSFDKESEWDFIPSGFPSAGEQRLSAADVKLINYLAKHNHWSPFAHTSIQLRVKAPVFCARQLVKHQVGGVWNEVSRRYVDSEPEFYFPEVWRGRPVNAKQGSSGVIDYDQTVLTAMSIHEDFSITKLEMWPEDMVQLVVDHYNHLLKVGVAPEQARMILPQNMMSEWYWTGSLMFFCRVCRERLAPGAQQETREVAEQIAEIVAPLFPVSWSALMESKGN